MTVNVARVNGRSTADADLETDVRDAIDRSQTVRIWGHALQFRARDGVVEFTGHVRTRPGRFFLEQIVRQVPGVREIINHVYVDTDLEIAVAQALGQDPRTAKSFPGILVGSAFGEVFLKGNVATQEIKTAAAEIAAKIPGVREVNNQLELTEAPTTAAAAAKPTAATAKPAAAAKPGAVPAKPGAVPKPGAPKPVPRPVPKPVAKPVAAKPAAQAEEAAPAETTPEVAIAPKAEATEPAVAPAAESVATAPEQTPTAAEEPAAVEKPVAKAPTATTAPAAKPAEGAETPAAKPAAKPGAKPGMKPFRKPYNQS